MMQKIFSTTYLDERSRSQKFENSKFLIWIRGRPLAAISKLSLGNPLKVSSRDRKWSLDHRESDQSSAGSIKTWFKSPELRCQNLRSKLKFLKKSIFLKSSYIGLNKSPQVFLHAELIFNGPGTPRTLKWPKKPDFTKFPKNPENYIKSGVGGSGGSP